MTTPPGPWEHKAAAETDAVTDHRWPLWIAPRPLGTLLFNWSLISFAQDVSDSNSGQPSRLADTRLLTFWTTSINGLSPIPSVGPGTKVGINPADPP